MKELISLLIGLAALATTINTASATIINVPASQPSIQAGINAASPGDTVLVQPGRYVENIDFKGKDIVVGSLFIATRDTSYISQTVIDAQKKNTVVVFKSGETSAAELGGFTLTNGKSLGNVTNQGDPGGGIFCKNASPYLHHLIVEGNFTDLQGGGMYLEKSNSVIEYCVIRNNRGVIGAGGIELLDGNYEVRNCILNENKGFAAGIHCLNSTARIFRILLYNNFSSEVFRISSSNVNIINSTIANQYGYSLQIFYSDVNIINSIFWNDSPQIRISDGHPEMPISHVRIAFSDIKGGIDQIKVISDSLYYENNNIKADPLFKNITKGDFTLSKGSPCIDSGIPFYQINGTTIINFDKSEYKGLAPDIGYFESDYNSTHVKESIIPDLSLSNFPNPFNSDTIIHFSLPNSCNSMLSIYSITGQKVIDLLDTNLLAGDHQIKWNGTDRSGKTISSGAYVLHLNAGNRSVSKGILYVK
jgi:hypothetical protein